MPHDLATHLINSGPLAGPAGKVLFGLALLVLLCIGISSLFSGGTPQE